MEAVSDRLPVSPSINLQCKYKNEQNRKHQTQTFLAQRSIEIGISNPRFFSSVNSTHSITIGCAKSVEIINRSSLRVVLYRNSEKFIGNIVPRLGERDFERSRLSVGIVR